MRKDTCSDDKMLSGQVARVYEANKQRNNENTARCSNRPSSFHLEDISIAERDLGQAAYDKQRLPLPGECSVPLAKETLAARGETPVSLFPFRYTKKNR